MSLSCAFAVMTLSYLTTKAVRILNCELNSYRLREEFSCGSPNFSRFSLLVSVHLLNKL